MRKRKTAGKIPGDPHASSEDLIWEAAMKLLTLKSLDDIHDVKTKLDQVLERESRADNVLEFTRNR